MPPDLTGRPSPPPNVRVQPPTLAELSAAQRAVHEAIVSGPRGTGRTVPLADEDGRLAGPFGLMLLAPQVGQALQQVGAALRFGSGLSVRCRELATLTVAARLGSAFEWWAHERIAATAGITPEQMQRVLDGSVPDGLDEQERVVVLVTGQLVERRSLTDEEYARAEDILGRALLAELTWLVGYYAALALALEVFRPPHPR
jgi:alkylhydroperoxidase family enzyme